jgi:HK97 family phage prohead protease
VENLAFRPELKEAGNDGTAVFLASVFGNVDLTNDVVEPGAFRKFIKSTPPERVAFLADHTPSVSQRLGFVKSLRETKDGLLVEARFNLEKQLAREVYSDFKMEPQAAEFSFGYEPVKFEFDAKGVRHLHQIDLYDVSAVWKGANPETRLVSVKTAIAAHNTAVREGSWDGNAAMSSASSAADYRAICAWFEGSDPDLRSSYKFPHHASPGGPAILDGVRNGLSRLPQASIPSSDVAGVRRHLETHLDAAKSHDSIRRIGLAERLALAH